MMKLDKMMRVMESTEPAAGIEAESPKCVGISVAGLAADSPVAAQMNSI